MRPYHEGTTSQHRHRTSTSTLPTASSLSPPSTPSLTPATPSLLKSPIPESPSQQHTFTVPSLTRASISAQSGSAGGPGGGPGGGALGGSLASLQRERESISRASLSHTPSYSQLREREDKEREKRVAERRRLERFGNASYGYDDGWSLTSWIDWINDIFLADKSTDREKEKEKDHRGHRRGTTHPFVLLSALSLFVLSCIVLLQHLHPSPWLATDPWLFSRPPPKLSAKHLASSPLSSSSNRDSSSSSSSSSNAASSNSNLSDLPYTSPNPATCSSPQTIHVASLLPREKAAIVTLLRESDLDEFLPTLKNFESVFNSWARYPYVLIADPVSSGSEGKEGGGFSKAFKESVRKSLPRAAVVKYVEIDEESWWSIPSSLARNYSSSTFGDDGLDSGRTELRRMMKRQEEEGVMYAGREGYHHMCRFYSGGWARLEGLKEFDWFWRLEPGVRFFCQIPYDPFRYLSLHKKIYGFVIATVENFNTIPSLFDAAKDVAKSRGWEMGRGWKEFLVRKKGEEVGQGQVSKGGDLYTGCHFWTNFEIGDLRFFRSAKYQSFFDGLDAKGGFYTERWGDAPVRALALGYLADIDQIHHFEDLGYKHDFFMHCPSSDRQKEGVGCDCRCPKYSKEALDLDTDWKYSCLPRWKDATELEWKIAA